MGGDRFISELSAVEEAREVARGAGWPWEWVRGAADAEAVLEHGCWFDVKAGEKVVNFFAKYLRHSKGKWAGKPFILLDWQRDDLIMPLFSWKRPDNTRRFRRAYIEVPKKNGKSTIAAGLALDGLTFDNEAAAEVYCAAESRDQAGVVFREAMSMVRASPELRHRLKIIESKSRIEYPKMGSFYRALSREAGVSEGINMSRFLFDELHTQKNRTLWDATIYSGINRGQPLHASITTSGWNRETICWEEHEYARGVLDGTIKDFAYLALIYAAAAEDDWADPAVWRKANPSFGVTIDEAEFAEECRRALAEPRKLNSFLRYRLNIWTQQETAWLAPEAWAACAADYSREEMMQGLGSGV